MSIELLHEIKNNETLNIYEKKKSIITLGQNVDTFTDSSEGVHLAKNMLLDLIELETFKGAENKSLRQLIITRSDKFDNSILEKFTDNEWSLIDDMANDKINEFLTYWGLILLMTKHIGRTNSYVTPRHFFLASAVYESKDLAQNKLASIKSLYKKYSTGISRPKITKFI